jgi:predicted adenylyl cyclase CyaB
MDPLEIEIKYMIPGGADAAQRLAGRLGDLIRAGGGDAQQIGPRHFEDNILLDYPGTPIRRQGCGLRLRLTPLADTFTWKGAAKPDPLLKIREEIEVRVEEGKKLLTILERIGLRTIFRYQKFRQVFDLRGGLTVVIDETPMGWFTELEGPPEEIDRVSRELELPPEHHVRASYAGFFVMEMERQGRKGETEVVFSHQRLEEEKQ